MKTEEELCDFLGKDVNKIEKLCRICLSDNLCNAALICKDSQRDTEDVEILEAKINMDGELSLWEKIAVFGRVKVKYEDDLLKYICEQCCLDLDIAYTFRVKCHKAERLFMRVLRTLTGKHNMWGTSEVKKDFVEIPVVGESEDIKDVSLNIKEECSDFNLEEDFHANDDDSVVGKEKIKTEKVSTKRHAKNLSPGSAKRVKCEDDDEETSEDCKETSYVMRYGVLCEADDDDEKKHKCNECQKSFATMSSLISHMNRLHCKEKKEKLGIVTGYGAERRINCPECDYKCKRWQSFNYHMATHTGAKPYKCDQCDKRFAQHSSLNYHKVVHSEVMQFTCQECGKQFKRKDLLYNHHKVHNTELNFKCHICSKGLKSQKTLDEHIKRHLQIKDHSCEICGKSFVGRAEITNHMLIHNRNHVFNCTICSYTTTYRSNLKSHIRRHSGLRPFQCDQCDYAGVTTTELQSHLVKHSKIAKHSCPVCDVKFRHKSGVNRHMVKKHGEKSKCE